MDKTKIKLFMYLIVILMGIHFASAGNMTIDQLIDSYDFSYYNGTMNITGQTDYMIDSDSDGANDTLSVILTTDASSASTYKFIVEIEDQGNIFTNTTTKTVSSSDLTATINFRTNLFSQNSFNYSVRVLDSNDNLVFRKYKFQTNTYDNYDKGISIISFSDKNINNDFLRINLTLNVTQNQTSNITIILTYNSSSISSIKEASLTQGIRTVSIDFDNETIKSTHFKGNFTIYSVIIGEKAIKTNYSTSIHNYEDFAKTSYIKSYADSHVDTDNNSLYEYLEINFSVIVKSAGDYTLEAELYDEFGNYLDYINKNQSLNIGNQTIQTMVNCSEIYKLKIDGPYLITYAKLSAGNDTLDIVYQPYTTNVMYYNDFERPPLPDLKISMNLTFINLNNQTNITLNITNIGAAPAFNIFVDIFDNRSNENQSSITFLDIGQSGIFTFVFSNTTNDTIFIGIADFDNIIEESNESNNIAVYYLNPETTPTEINLTTCANLNSAGTTYYLLNDINASSNCFNITANDVVFDGQGHSITGLMQFYSDKLIYAEDADNITVKNVTIKHTEFSGIYFTDITNSKIKDVILNETLFDEVGTCNIYFDNVDNTEIQNCLMEYPAYSSIYLQNSKNNIIENNTIRNLVNDWSGADGLILLSYNSTNNVIRNNIITSNCSDCSYPIYAIKLSNSTGYIMEENQIYNNLFNISEYLDVSGGGWSYWNTTKQSGDRIYGEGDYIGGNYYTNPSKSGYSDICMDSDFDGLCDSQLTLATSNIDFLPLTINKTNQPKLSIQLNEPNASINVTQNQFFSVIINVTCLELDCGNINVSLDPLLVLQSADNENMDDTFDNSYSNDTNYGSNITLRVQGADPAGPQGSMQSYFRWNITQLPYNSDIDSLNISLFLLSNTLDAGEGQEVTSFFIYYNCSWNEHNLTYNSRMWECTGDPVGDIIDFNNSSQVNRWYDLELFNDIDSYAPNETLQDAINNHLSNWSFYYGLTGITCNPNCPSTWDDYTEFASKEYPNSSLRPKLNVKYHLVKSGLVSTIVGSQPFYTNSSSNPITINLHRNQSQLVTFWVNATGDSSYTHEFFVYANLTYNMSISNQTAHWNVTIVPPPPPNPRVGIELISPLTKFNATQNHSFNFTTQVCCFNDNCGEINVSLDPESEPAEYTSSTYTICSSGRCTKTIYSGTRFVFEENKWKKIEEARSLKGVWQVIKKEDLNYPLDVIDYNYSSITLDLSVSDNKLNKNMPLQVYDKDNSSDLIINNKILIQNKGEKRKIIIDLSDTKESILGQEIKWGENSTTIQLKDPESQNMDDGYAKQSSATMEYGADIRLFVNNVSSSSYTSLIKFNVSSLPSGSSIINASLNLYQEYNGLDSGESLNVSVYRVNQNWGWTEGTGTATGNTCTGSEFCWNHKPNTSDYNMIADDWVNISNTGSGYWRNWSVKSGVQFAVDNNYFNLSIYIISKVLSGSPSSTDYVRFYSKEYSTDITLRPYLNITYSSGSGGGGIQSKNGLVNTTKGAIPFYTNGTNPRNITLNQNQCLNVTWWVNATGNIGSTYPFFAYANLTSNLSISNRTNYVNITIVT